MWLYTVAITIHVTTYFCMTMKNKVTSLFWRCHVVSFRVDISITIYNRQQLFGFVWEPTRLLLYPISAHCIKACNHYTTGTQADMICSSGHTSPYKQTKQSTTISYFTRHLARAKQLQENSNILPKQSFVYYSFSFSSYHIQLHSF